MLRDGEIARRENGQTLLRAAGLRVGWELAELVSADGHTLRGSFSCTAGAIDDPTERKMLEETLLANQASAGAQEVSDHFSTPLLAAARAGASRWAVKDLLQGPGQADLRQKLIDAAKPVAFACGLELAAPFALHLDSATLRREQAETAQRQLSERRAAEQVSHLQRAAQLLEQFEVVQKASPRMPAVRILERIGAADQPEMLRMLLAEAAKNGPKRSLWVVAGPSLIQIDPTDGRTIRHLTLPEIAGPLRSVQSCEVDGKTHLLVGARSGVLLLDPDNPHNVAVYRDPEIVSAQGFNGAVVWGHEIWATHGDGGLVCWTMGNCEAPKLAVRAAEVQIGAFTPRCPVVLDERRIVVPSDNRIIIVRRDGTMTAVPCGPVGSIVMTTVEGAQVVTVHDDGQVCRHEQENLSCIDRLRRAGRVTAAAAMPWLGTTRLLLAAEEGPVLCIGLEDEMVMQYSCPYRGLRAVSAAADYVAAVTPDRQQVVIWKAWDGRKISTSVHIAGVARHRIADARFV